MLVRMSFGVCVIRIRQQHNCIRKVFIFYRFLSFFGCKGMAVFEMSQYPTLAICYHKPLVYEL